MCEAELGGFDAVQPTLIISSASTTSRMATQARNLSGFIRLMMRLLAQVPSTIPS